MFLTKGILSTLREKCISRSFVLNCTFRAEFPLGLNVGQRLIHEPKSGLLKNMGNHLILMLRLSTGCPVLLLAVAADEQHPVKAGCRIENWNRGME